MTGRGTAGQLRTRAGTWHQWRPTSPESPTRWASTGSRLWVILAAARTPWPAPRPYPGGSWPRCLSAPAPFGAEGLDWFAGMTPSGAAEYRAAATGRAALEAYLASAEFDPEVFTPADHAALFGAWSWMGPVVDEALETDQGGMVDDDLAYVTPWGCDPREINTPVLFVHGAQDRLVPSSHGTWLAQRCRTAELWLRPDDGHVSILNSSVTALDWLRERASHR